jgi:hypothetical protein
MKKLILSLAMIASVFASCSIEETAKNTEVQGEIFGTVKLGFKAPANNSTSKGVRRNTLPVEIDEILIKVAVVGDVPFIYRFQLVPNDETDADSTFIIRNVKTGIVRFEVETTSKLPEFDSYANKNGKVYKLSDGYNMSSVIDSLSNEQFHITYKSKSILEKEVVAGNNTDIAFELVPNHGRVISLFDMSDQLKLANYTMKVQSGIAQNGGLPVNMLTGTTCDKNGFIAHVSSAAYSSTGHQNSMYYKVIIFDELGIPSKDIAIIVPINNGVSTNTLYTITSEGSSLPSSTQTIFTIPKLENLPPVSINK